MDHPYVLSALPISKLKVIFVFQKVEIVIKNVKHEKGTLFRILSPIFPLPKFTNEEQIFLN